MLYYLVAALLLLHGAFWGAGLSRLILPRAWRGAWWAFAVPLGWSLQSAVVWMGAHLPLEGTASYARYSEVLPLALLAWSLRRRLAPANLRSVAAVGILMALGALLLLAPLAQRGAWTLTTSSLGSCDQADYAAGARVLQEFSRTDRIGFLDLPEVTRIGGVERFFDYWLKLNHFSPSALIAHNAAVLSLEPHQLVSVTAAVFWVSLVPAGFLLARSLGWPRGRRWAVGAAWAITPLGAYLVHHGAMGQMLATHGIVLLTLLLVDRQRGVAIPGWSAFAVALAALWLIAGSYNFILAIALAPAGAGLLLVAAARREPRPMVRALWPVLAALGGTVLLFWGRFEGIAERFRLLEQYSFGWPVPLLTPEGWLGVVRDSELRGWPPLGRGLAASLVLVAAGWAWAAQARRGRRTAWWALGWLAAVAAGWAVLAWESRVRANASYDAFKVLTVFLPLLLPVLLGWFAFARGRQVVWAGVGLLALGLGGLPATAEVVRRMADPVLRVEPSLLALRRIEASPQIASVNLRIRDFWSRLWANALLLRKPHYFPTHTYEARLDTPLAGEWDLSDAIVRSLPRDGDDVIELNPRFHAVRVGAAALVAAEFGSGWHAAESTRLRRKRWMAGRAGTIVLRVEDAAGQRVALEFEWRAFAPQGVRVSVNGSPVGRVDLGTGWERSAFAARLEPGANLLLLEVDRGPVAGAPGDPRALAVALAGLTIRPMP